MSDVDWSTLETQARDRIQAKVSDFKTGRVFVAASVDLARTKSKGTPAASVTFAGVDRFTDESRGSKPVQRAFGQFVVTVFAELAKGDGLAFIPAYGLVKKVCDALRQKDDGTPWYWVPGNGGPVFPTKPVRIAPPDIDGGMAIVPITFETSVNVS